MSTPPRAARTRTAPLVADEVPELFREAMAGLCSGVAVITARRPEGDPCGLVATSVSSFSARPPAGLGGGPGGGRGPVGVLVQRAAPVGAGVRRPQLALPPAARRRGHVRGA